MTTTFAHRTSIPFKELIEGDTFKVSDLGDGICSQRLVPSYFIKGEVWEHCVDSSGVWRKASGAFKNEEMFLVKPKSTGLLDCEFQFCATTANAIEMGLPIFKIGPPGYVQERVSLADVLENGSVVISELLRYQAFCLSLQRSESSSALPRWPWGMHHTKALGHLEAAATKFWVNYDPMDSNTAETNESVSKWLQDKHEVTKYKADAIASILRPEDLRPGPRK